MDISFKSLKSTRTLTRHIGRAALGVAICVAVAPLSSFAEAKQVTLKATGYSGSTTLTDFQALVKLSDNDAYGFSYTDCVASDGSDLWFEDANGNLIPHDIDTWNANGDSYVWVKIPSLSRDTQIVMHWGAARTQAQTCTPTNTWSGYVGVWHMNADGTTAEPDKTGHGLNAAPLNTSSSGVSFNAEAGIVVGTACREDCAGLCPFRRADRADLFSFLMREGGRWELAPAYDLTGCHFSPADSAWDDWQNQHALSVNGKFSHITDDNILAIGERYGIGTASKVLARVKEACDSMLT